MSRRRGTSKGPRPAAVRAAPAAREPLLGIACALAVSSFLERWLFVRATPDAGWAYAALYKGDAALWVDYASALHAGRPFELGLPLHPPGAAYLIAWLWDGSAAALGSLRIVWAALGAATVVVAWDAARRAFGPAVGLLVGALVASADGLLVLSGSLDAETPYLLLVVAALWLVDGLRSSPTRARLAAWAAANGVACLFRVEHALAFALTTAWLAWGWRRQTTPALALLARLALAGGAFLLPLVPWHVSAWRAVARFDDHEPEPRPDEAAALARVEARVAGLTWDDDARQARDRLPAFARRTAADFVAATVAHRGGAKVTAADFAILDQAFGGAPRAVARFPFVSVYGPLNFALANHPAADGGFSRAALEDPPPLVADPGRYPPALVRGLPPPDLTLAYPPHARLVTDGYARGVRWIAADPGGSLRRAARKLARFWSGAVLGWTGENLPTGASGLRRAVDLTVPEGPLAAGWRIVLLAACALGLRAGAGRAPLSPWLLYALSKIVTTLLYFGYARQGALVIPVVALLLALAAERRLGPERASRRATALAATLIVAAVGIDAARWLRRPQVVIDGVAVTTVDPFPSDVHRDQRVEVR